MKPHQRFVPLVQTAAGRSKFSGRGRCPRPRGTNLTTGALVLVLASLGITKTGHSQDLTPNAAPNQWFTGSLEAPSPALPKAGMLALEPYEVIQSNTGIFGGDGAHHSVANDTATAETLLVIKYALTDHLTIEALPAISHSWANHASPTGTTFGDLPIELEYRVSDGNYRNGAPSVTFDVGVTAPTGNYDHLDRPLDGVGVGAWILKEGVVVQSLFDTWHNHPVRLRAWASAFQPLDDPGVTGLSVYGTTAGFHGAASPGASAQIGLAGGYALDRHFVLALDLVDTYADGFKLNGVDAAEGAIKTHAPIQNSFALAPALEYNWSADAGLIFGMEFTAAGRNTPSYVAPQIALAISF